MAHHAVVADGPGERTACGDSGRNAAETRARPRLDPQRRPPGAARLSGGRDVLQSVGRVHEQKSHGAPTSVRGSEFLFVGARRPELRALRARSMIDRWTAPAPPDLSEARAGLLDLLAAPDRVTSRRRGLVVGMTA